ncbi:hypothetical protein D3C77_04640 [compost metagenome]
MENQAPQVTPIAASLATDIAKHCAAFEQSPEYAEMIRAHVKKLYDEAINDTFRWGKFPNAVKEALQAALPANISEMVDLPRYNLLMARALAEQWETAAVGDQVVKHMQDLVLKFVKEDATPEFILASDLWAAYIEEHKEEALHNGWESPHVVTTDEDGFFYIGLCKEPESGSSYRSSSKDKPYQCDIYLGFHHVTDSDRKTVKQDGHEVYTLFAGQLDNSDVLGKKPVQFRGRFEKLVGALYYGNSKLVLNEDADDIYYPGYD